MVDELFDSRHDCLVFAVHVNLSRCFCIVARFEQASVHEYVVGLLAVFCSVERCSVIVLLFNKNMLAIFIWCWTALQPSSDLSDPVVACQRRCVLLDDRDCDRVVVSVVESLRVVGVVVF